MAIAASASPVLDGAIRAGLAQLAADGLYFAPVRHHSPACALALQALIREVRPAAVLIEGPDDFDALLPLLLDPDTRPPVAVLSQAALADGEPAGVRSAFYPFCDYSPEWVALREGHAAGAQLAFIDRPWHAAPCEQDDDSEEMRSLMSERYLAHSDYLKALATRSGCRDQDELWDHLFELRPAAALRDWRQLFADVYTYCAMARADYEPAVLEAEGSLPRERHMARHLRAWLARGDGPIVVVTGGFHTIALQQMLQQRDQKDQRLPAAAGKRLGNWLIRYSFDRLDALSGYAAGMPAPAYYQAVWESTNAAGDGPALHAVAADSLTALARETRTLGLDQQISTADVQAALLQAMRLAQLRGHAGPGRQDLLDAVRSCFIKGAIDDGTSGIAADIRRHMGGSRLGDVPPSAGSPPLLENARRIAAQMRVRLDDSQPRSVRLDIHRKPHHRERSRFLHLMSYLDAGLARWQSGPDFIGGSALDTLSEEWRVAWNPLVEARMIELATQGTTLAAVALARLLKEQEALQVQGQGRSAAHAVTLLTRACLIGLHQQLPALTALIASLLDDDANAASVIACGHKLLLLWHGREPLGLQEHPRLLPLLLQAWHSALYLMPQLADVKPEDEAGAIDQLRSLRTLQGSLRQLEQQHVDDLLWCQQLERIATAPAAAPGVASAAGAMLFIDGSWSEARLAAMLKACFGAGAVAGDAVRGLKGLMAAAPELLLTQASLRDDIGAMLAGWDEATFVSFLPDLRHAFALLKPQETARLAETLAGPGQQALAEMHYDATEADLMAGAALQAALADSLERDGLAAWITQMGAADGR